MGRLELQFNGIPLLLGYIPVNREPRWGLLNGQLLMADVNTTDSRAKSFKRGVCTGSFRKFTFLAKTFLAPELHRLVTVLVGKNVNDIRLDGLFRLRGFTALQGEQT